MGLSAAEVERVRVTVSGPGISPDLVEALDRTGGECKGVVDYIPAGTDRTFLAEGLDGSSTLVYEGSVSGVTVGEGEPVSVVLVLQQSAPPTPFSNSAPYFIGMTLSAAGVAVSQPVSLTVTAADPDPADTLSYLWGDGACAGSFAGETTASPTWTAPATAGSCTVTVTVSDGCGAQASMSTTIDVHE